MVDLVGNPEDWSFGIRAKLGLKISPLSVRLVYTEDNIPYFLCPVDKN